MTSPRLRLRADASRNRERILEAAREAIRDCGTEVSLNEVARRAGVGNATVYRHFATRGELIHQATLSSISVLAEEAEQVLAQETDVFETLRHFMHRLLGEGIGTLCPFVADVGGTTAPEVDQAWKRLEHVLEALMIQAREAGRLRADVDVDDLVIALAQLTRPLPGTVYADFQQSAHRHLRLFLDGLRVPAQSARPGPPA
ncbi:TetR/AcrR family transcriptional regulator [Streptomyces sp. WM6386]|uniref:TetR/AcrR family transcriptional regulator n=1 Tax=Streptomyces sp. WM6386 TaxID=1415558 RepID=UPI0006194DD1|nr:TetR/AcrR family transcriptional regulator [Streptomyces sp. WM6386]KKD06652.1 hypothetical protein TN53_17780 [Streptomyces sp. WM6386]